MSGAVPAPSPDAAAVDQEATWAKWAARAEALLEQALAELRDGHDCLPTLSAAQTALRIEAGELPDDTMDGYHFPGEDDETLCTCPPDLVARGGWSSRCLRPRGAH